MSARVLAFAPALKVAATITEGVIVVICPDAGARYQSEKFWEAAMKLSQQLLHRIHCHLESGYPNEACGVMLGKDGVITEIVSADNERTDLPASGGRARVTVT